MNIKADHRKMQNYPEFPFSTLLTIAPTCVWRITDFPKDQQFATHTRRFRLQYQTVRADDAASGRDVAASEAVA